MKTTIAIHENEQWNYYPVNSKIEHISRTTAGECFFFDPVKSSVTSVIPQRATAEDPRAGHLMISIKLDARELDWFLDRPSRIKGLKEWFKNVSKADAKRYALELSVLPVKEIEEKAIEFDAKSAPLTLSEKNIALQFITSIIAMHTINPEIFVIARNQKDDLIINVLKHLPKAFRKVEISMPWSSGLDLGRISITDEDELPAISRPMYAVSELSQKLISNFPEQFAVAKMFFDDSRWAVENLEPSDISNKSEKFKKIYERLRPHRPAQVKSNNNNNNKMAATQNKPCVSVPDHSVRDEKHLIDTIKKSAGKNVKSHAKDMKLRDIMMLVVDEILLAAAYIYYLKYIADSNRLYTVGFLSVMAGILFSSLIFYFTDKNN